MSLSVKLLRQSANKTATIRSFHLNRHLINQSLCVGVGAPISKHSHQAALCNLHLQNPGWWCCCCSNLQIARQFQVYSGPKLKKASVFQDLKEKKQQQTDEIFNKGDKVMKVKLKSTRVDYIIKAGLQISRNKVEKTFYDDRVRVNGARPKKKSQLIYEGDEVDIIRSKNELNPEFLDVSRIEVVQLGEEEEIDNESLSGDEEESDTEGSARIPATLKRYKRLTIENYDEPWKGPVEK